MMTTTQIKACLEALSNPQFDYQTVHIGGTNGKGSTTYFLSQLLGQTKKVGMYVSPYFMKRFDNIWIDGKEVSHVYDFYQRYLDVFQSFELTPFEEDTALALLIFKHYKVDIAIIEVGLGGTHDATNVIDSEVVIITSTSLEHDEIIGPTLSDIAVHQAGIITSSKQQVIISNTILEPMKSIFLNQVKDKKAKLLDVKTYDISMTPSYQIHNLQLAMTAYQYFIKQGPLLNSYRMLPFRFEKAGHIIYDGAHNEEGMRALVSSLKQLKLRPIVIMSTLKTKDTKKMIDIIQEVSDTIYGLTFDHLQAIDEATITSIQGVELKRFDEVNPMLKNPNYGMILVTGSLYFIKYIKDKLYEQ